MHLKPSEKDLTLSLLVLLLGKCRVRLSRKGPKMSISKLFVFRISTLARKEALFKGINLKSWDKNDIEILKSYARLFIYNSSSPHSKIYYCAHNSNFDARRYLPTYARNKR